MIPVVDGAVVVICDGNVANMQLPLLIGGFGVSLRGADYRMNSAVSRP